MFLASVLWHSFHFWQMKHLGIETLTLLRIRDEEEAKGRVFKAWKK